MTDVQIKVDLDGLDQTRSGTIDGPIWVELDGWAFPEKGWYDFPVVLLGWWSQALRAHDRTHADVVLDFMDGPYEMRLNAAEGGCRVIFYDRHGSGHVEREATVDCARLRTSIHREAERVLVHCRENGWENDDVATLAHQVGSTGDA